MFSCNSLAKLLLQPQKMLVSVCAKKNLSKVSFGIEMPDKLYKKIELEMKSCEHAVLKSYLTFVKTAANHLDIDVTKVFCRKKPTFHRFTVLKSAFVHRKHLVQYEIRTYYTWVELRRLTGSTADTFLEYIQRMLPEGVALKVTRVAVEPLPIHLTPEESSKLALTPDSKQK